MVRAYEQSTSRGSIAKLDVTDEHSLVAKRTGDRYSIRLLFRGQPVGPVFAIRSDEVEDFWTADGSICIQEQAPDVRIKLNGHLWALVFIPSWESLLATADNLNRVRR